MIVSRNMPFLSKGIIFGQTAFKIFYNLSKNNNNNDLLLNEIHLKLEPTDFDEVQNKKIFNKKLSNCKLEVNHKNVKYLLYKNNLNENFFELELSINSTIRKVNIENILNVEIDVLLEPLINLRKCSNINEALMNWSLNSNFKPSQVYINHENIIPLIPSQTLNIAEKSRWMLTNKYFLTFSPKRLINKIKKIHNNKNKTDDTVMEFLNLINNINMYFTEMVKKYNKNISPLNSYTIDFPIELYGNKDEILHSKRKSLYMIKRNKDDLHLKSFAILFYLKWFFNTRYNYKKIFGLDGEYGQTLDGLYGQTFHKYDDVLLWLVTHPCAINETEFVVLDQIPPNYIF